MDFWVEYHDLVEVGELPKLQTRILSKLSPHEDRVTRKKMLSSRLAWLIPGNSPLRLFQEEIHQPEHYAFLLGPREFRDNSGTGEVPETALLVAFSRGQSFRKNSQTATN